MKPLIFYVDDEPHNLTVFEAALPSEWDIKVFDNPLHALEALNSFSPTVLVTDQRMPGTTGVRFLELARKIHPDAIRIIVTGYSDEDLVVESVRKAQIFDYIKKPWEPDDLEASIRRALELYKANAAAKQLMEQLQAREATLTAQNEELKRNTDALMAANQRENDLRKELECWVPRPLLNMLTDPQIRFPLRRDIVGITFDIIDGSRIHGQLVDGRSVFEHLIKLFSEAVMRNGGWRESHSGDSAYGHFGLWENLVNPFQGALLAAQEFRTMIRSFAQRNELEVECGISLHVARQSLVNIHKVQIETAEGPVIQKSFDTSSIEIDLLHRIEKITHDLPGSNIIMSGEFVRSLRDVPKALVPIGSYLAKGQEKPVDLFLLPSDSVTAEELERVRIKLINSASIQSVAA